MPNVTSSPVTTHTSQTQTCAATTPKGVASLTRGHQIRRVVEREILAAALEARFGMRSAALARWHAQRLRPHRTRGVRRGSVGYEVASADLYSSDSNRGNSMSSGRRQFNRIAPAGVQAPPVGGVYRDPHRTDGGRDCDQKGSDAAAVRHLVLGYKPDASGSRRLGTWHSCAAARLSPKSRAVEGSTRAGRCGPPAVPSGPRFKVKLPLSF